MKSENRLNVSKYEDDNTVGMQLEDSPWDTILATSAVIAGGVLAYKTGLLKKGISKLIDYTSNYKSTYPEAIQTIKQWANKSASAIKLQDVDSSLIRNTGLLSINKLFSQKGRNEIKTFASKLFDPVARKEILEHTSRDLSDLGKKINEKKTSAELKNLKLLEHSYNNSTFMKTLNGMHSNIKELREAGINGEQAKQARRQMTKDFIDRLTYTAEQGATDIKRTGHRKLTFGDVIEKYEVDGKAGYRITNGNFRVDKEFRRKVDEFLGNKFVDSDGVTKTVLESNKYKNMIIDEALLVNEKGKISDLRGSKKSFNFLVSSLARDFKIPVIGINPLRMFGLDQVGKAKYTFGVLHKDTIQSIVTGTNEKLGKTMFFSNGSIYGFDELGKMTKIKSNMHIRRVDGEAKYLDRELESLRKMSNIKRTEHTKFTKSDGWFKNTYGKIMEKLDIGFTDVTNMENRELGAGDFLNPNTYIEKMSDLLKKSRFKPFKGSTEYTKFSKVFGEGPTEKSRTFVAMNNSVKIGDVLKGEKTIGDFIGQLGAGRRNLQDVTTASTHFFYLFDRVNSTLNIPGLGLSTESLSSAGGILKNLILKRALPVYAGYQAYEYLNYLSETKDKSMDNNKPHNISQFVATQLATTKLAYHKVKDFTGVTDIAKNVTRLLPGIDQIAEIPGLNALDLDKTFEEQKDYYNNGLDPVRKARFWDIGLTPFTGGKIDYFKPNWYRNVMADVKFSDSLYGSRDEYFANAPFPTLQHPFAPLKHFVTDKYHWEEKHYRDRPYMLTSPAFENVPVVGPVLSATIGQMIKPQKTMHRGEDERANYLQYSGITTGLAESDLATASSVVSNTIAASAYKTHLYTTSSGSVKAVGIDGSKSTRSINNELKDYSIRKMLGATETLNNITGVSPQEDAENPSNLINAIGSGYNNLSNFLGLYGYTVRTATGKANQGKVFVETSGYAQSLGKQFWDANLGGLGGEVSEIFRRFIPQRGPNNNYYNPIRNNMPEWMPGADYFTDFKHGDPYVKISNGEMRLPGEGYERLYGIDIKDMGIGSSFIGKSQEDIVKHYLHMDEVLDDKFTTAGTQLHSKIEKEWLRSGYAFDTEGKISDALNNVIGFYDARVRDADSPNGQAIADIKTVSDHVFQDVKKNGSKDYHMKQVNYYLWATGTPIGIIHYVNRDTGETLDNKFNFNKDMFNDTMKNLYGARDFILNGINNGTLSRADLYDPIDKLRILGDTAPYSNEYKQMKAYVSRISTLTEEQKQQITEIDDRASAVRKPKRLYGYKFKNQNIVKKDIEVYKILTPNTFLAKGFSKPIKLAGMEVVLGDDPVRKAEIEKFLGKYLHVGSDITIGIDEDATGQEKSGSIRAVVYSNGINLNRELINRGYAKEKETENNAAAIYARFNGLERLAGSIWERFAHLDTPFHTKFLQVRSAAESYERANVYGKDFAEWNDPVKDFIKPMLIDRNVNRGLVTGLSMGVFIGTLFGENKYGRIVGGTIGGLSVLAAKMYATVYESTNNEKWKPKRVRTENEINEYIDTLKYVKYKKLYNEYADKAQREDHINIRKYIGAKKSEGLERKKQIKELEKMKNLIKSKGVSKAYSQAIMDGKLQYIPKQILNSLYEKVGGIEELRKAITDKDTNVFDAIKNAVAKFSGEGTEDLAVKHINKQLESIRTYREVKSKFGESSKNELESMDRMKDLYTLIDTIKDVSLTDKDKIEEISKVRPKYVKIDTKDFNRDEILMAINKEIATLTKDAGLSENAVKAIQYYNMSEKTMYAYDPGDSIQDIASAMTKKDRDYFQELINAPDEEKMKILSIAPKYMRRALESQWGLTPEKKTSLAEHFKQHALPDKDWAGWNENLNLDIVKVKMMKKADIDFSDVGIWDNDVQAANKAGQIPLPKMDFRRSAMQTRDDLYNVLGKLGMQDIQIEMSYKNTDCNIDLDLKYDEKLRIERELDKNRNKLLED